MSKIAYGPTQMQKAAIDGIITEGKSAQRSMKDAGYSEDAAANPKQNLAQREGVRMYLETLDKKAINRFKMSLKDKAMEVFLDGLDANKMLEKLGIEYPDHKERREFALIFARFFGWVEQSNQPQVSKSQQFNFFTVEKKEQDTFNGRFRDFLKKYYKKP